MRSLFTLQWGHGISAVEIETAKPRLISALELQWGHGISAVEILRLFQ